MISINNIKKSCSVKYLQTSIALGMVLLATGCANNDMSDLSTFIAETKAKYVGQVEALPIITPYENRHYQVANIRDPFKSPVSLVKSISRKKSSNSKVKPSTLRNKEELEKFPLDSLTMVGIMNNNGQNWAIIKTPNNNVFRVRKGNYIGENNGKILNITETQITLKEIVADGLGGWVERRNKVALSN